jgi:hypothetical protein
MLVYTNSIQDAHAWYKREKQITVTKQIAQENIMTQEAQS